MSLDEPKPDAESIDEPDVDVLLSHVEQSPFSRAAFNTLKGKVDTYITELVYESSKVAKRHLSDTVSSAHVERASEYLVSGSSKRINRYLGTFGGILLGAAFSSFLSMMQNGQFPEAATLISAAIGVVGAFLVALGISRS